MIGNATQLITPEEFELEVKTLLEHRRHLGYVPEPLPDLASLAQMMMMAGSVDPLDRLWC